MPLVWKRVIDSQAEKLKELDKEIRPFRQNWEEADSMKSSVESLQNRVTELESVDKSAGQAARNTGEHEQDRSSDRSGRDLEPVMWIWDSWEPGRVPVAQSARAVAEGPPQCRGLPLWHLGSSSSCEACAVEWRQGLLGGVPQPCL